LDFVIIRARGVREVKLKTWDITEVVAIAVELLFALELRYRRTRIYGSWILGTSRRRRCRCSAFAARGSTIVHLTRLTTWTRFCGAKPAAGFVAFGDPTVDTGLVDARSANVCFALALVTILVVVTIRIFSALGAELLRTARIAF
jgi:hypothetical protein